MRRILILALLWLSCCWIMQAQTDVASISGHVTDPTSAVVSGADVTLTDTGTGNAARTKTNGAGLYTFPAVRPGTYRLAVRAQGFQQSLREGMVLHVQDRVTEDFALKVGSSNEMVVVTGDVPLINTESASVGTVINRQFVADMPLNGRSFQGLITLAPGVATVATTRSSDGQFVVNGQRSDTNYFTVDGVSANVAAPGSGSLQSSGVGATATTSSTGGFNTMLSVDALQEFRIATSTFAPEFGRTPGGQISLVSRSGTNSFHGNVFDYFRNTVLDANDWFLNAAAKPRGPVHENDFGGVVGGPVIKNKLFFFFSYEGLRLTAPTPSIKKVPTQAARDLAAKANSNGVVGYMAQFLNAFPLPDGNPSTPCTTYANCMDNYTANFGGKSYLNSYSGRVDYTLNSRMTLFGRYSHSPSSVANENSVDGTTVADNTDSYTAGWTWTTTNSTSNDLRFNFTRSTALTSVVPLDFKGSLNSIFPSGYAQFPSDPSMSYSIQIRGLATDGMVLSPKNAYSTSNGMNIVDTYAWVKGAHVMKFGADYRDMDPTVNQANFNQNNTFNQRTTALPGFPAANNVCPTTVLPAGSPATVPGFICGQATTSNLQHNYYRSYNLKQYSFYGQDTWKVSKRVTFTYGLRWEIDPAFSSTNNTPVFSVNASTFNVNDMSNIGINPFGAAPYATTWGNIAPRVGIAFRLSNDPNWGQVVRAGYGIFFDPGTQASGILGNPYNARFNNVGGGVNQPIVKYPIATSESIFVTLPLARTTLPVSQGAFDSIMDPNFKLPYVHQFNLTFEQQLGANQTVSVAYVGALGRRLLGALLFPAKMANVNTFAQINPITGAITPDALQVFGNYSSSDFRSLQASFHRQVAHGLGVVASYTWSHSIDNNSSSGALGTTTLPTESQAASGRPIGLLRGSSDFDIRHNLALSLVYDIPTPANAIADAVLGHWSIAPIFHYQTGVPIDIVTGSTGAIGGTAYGERPNVIPGVPIYLYGADCEAQSPGCPGGFTLNVAPVSASAAAAAGCLAPTTGPTANAKGAFCTPAPVNGQPVSGNLGRNVVRAYPLSEFDFSLHRDFPVHESVRLRFQGDIFNLFNHPSFGPENATLNNAQFGVTNSMANAALGAIGGGFNPIFQTGGPRNVQFSLKLFF